MNQEANEQYRLYKSQQKVQRQFQKWEPKTAEEAKKRWAEAKDTQDHKTLLQIYKRAGVEPIKLAKYICLIDLLVLYTNTFSESEASRFLVARNPSSTLRSRKSSTPSVPP
jgi:hypothetical protein